MTSTDNIGAPLPDFPRIWPSLFWIIGYLLLQIVTGIVGFYVAALQHPSLRAQMSDPNFVINNIDVLAVPILWSVLVSSLILCGMLWLYVSRDERAKRIGLTHFGTMPLQHALGLAAALIVAGMAFSAFISTYVFPDVEMQADMNKIMAAVPNTFSDQALRLLTVAVFGPIAEELLFRGLLQNAFMRHMRPAFAIALAALLFSLVHLQPYAIPGLMALGAGFGFLYYKTGSLRLTIMLHMLNNVAALYIGM